MKVYVSIAQLYRRKDPVKEKKGCPCDDFVKDRSNLGKTLLMFCSSIMRVPINNKLFS